MQSRCLFKHAVPSCPVQSHLPPSLDHFIQSGPLIENHFINLCFSGTKLSFFYRSACAGRYFEATCPAGVIYVASITMTMTTDFSLSRNCEELGASECSSEVRNCNKTCSRIVRGNYIICVYDPFPIKKPTQVFSTRKEIGSNTNSR